MQLTTSFECDGHLLLAGNSIAPGVNWEYQYQSSD